MPKGYRHLTRDQRCQLSVLIARREPVPLIARTLGVDRSSIYREIKRNSGGLVYHCEQADRNAKRRRYNTNHRRSKMKGRTLSIVLEKLKLQWSPEQIAGWLKKRKYKNTISHETIYKYVWYEKRMGRPLYKELRHRGKKYYRRGKGGCSRGSIPGRVDIDERPSIVEEKTRLGDWELDTILGHEQSGAIVSMVDRTSKLTKLARVPQKTAKEVANALISMLKPIEDFVITLTADNGKEFSDHREISDCLEAGFYFAKPYHSWERGLNEHTNGLVRQYLPKGTTFDTLSAERLMEIEMLLNNRPRKVLNFSTPLEVFSKLSKKTSKCRTSNLNWRPERCVKWDS